MDVREERRQPRNGDVVRQKIEFGNSPPDLGLRGKLAVRKSVSALLCPPPSRCSTPTYHGNNKHLGRNGGRLLFHLGVGISQGRISAYGSPQRANRQQTGGEGWEKHHGGAEVYCLEQ